MMNPMYCHPEDWSAFQRQRSANRKEVFEPSGALIRTMRMQPVISQANAESNCNPVECCRNPDGAPAGHEKSCQGSRVKDDQNDRSKPVRLIVVGENNGLGGQKISLKMELTIPTYQGISI